MNLLARLLLACFVLATIVLVGIYGSPLAFTTLPVTLATGAAFVDRLVGTNTHDRTPHPTCSARGVDGRRGRARPRLGSGPQ